MYGWHHYFRELAAILDRYWEGNMPSSARDFLRKEALRKWRAINNGRQPFPEELENAQHGA